jgi:hypothetical protein
VGGAAHLPMPLNTTPKIPFLLPEKLEEKIAKGLF